MRAKHHRNIRPGFEFNTLFPKAKGQLVSIKKNATVEDTIDEIKTIVASTLQQTKKIAQRLKGVNLFTTCKNNWEFVYNHIQYEEDRTFFEELREPARTWNDRKGDCDCMTIMLSSILTNQGIPHLLRITKYPKIWPEKPTWQHIYIVVPKNGNINQELEYKTDLNNYLALDCVVDSFNKEVPYLIKKDTKMELVRLNGIEDELSLVELESDDTLIYATDVNGIGYIGCAIEGDLYEYDPNLNGLGRTKAQKKAWKAEKKAIKAQPKTTRKEALRQHRENKPRTAAGKLIKKTTHAVMKANPAAALLRNGILASLKVNLFGVGKKMRYALLTESEAKQKGLDMAKYAKLKKTYNELAHRFKQAGGEEKNLRNAILKGKGNHKDPILNGFEGLDFISDVEYEVIQGIQGLGSLGEPATGAAVAAASGVMATIAASIKKIVGTGLFTSKSKNDKEAKEDKEDQANTAQTAQELNNETQQFAPNSAPITANQLTALNIAGEKLDATKLIADTTGVAQSELAQNTDPKTEEKSNMTPWLIGGGLLLAGIGLVAMNSNKPANASTVSGPPKKSSTKKKKAKGDGSKKSPKYKEVKL